MIEIKSKKDILKYIKKCSNYQDKDKLITYIKENNLSYDLDVLYEIIKIFIDNNISFNNLNEYEIIYQLVDKETFLKLIPNIIKLNDTKLDNDLLLYIFDNKDYLNNILKKLIELRKSDNFDDSESFNDIMLEFNNYMIETRRNFIDEVAYFLTISKVIDKIIESSKLKEHVIDILNKQLIEDKKVAGIYNIDSNEVKKYKEKIEKINEEYILYKEEKEKEIDILKNKLQETINLYDNLDKEIELMVNDKVKDIIEKINKENEYKSKEFRIMNEKLELKKRELLELKDYLKNEERKFDNTPSYTNIKDILKYYVKKCEYYLIYGSDIKDYLYYIIDNKIDIKNTISITNFEKLLDILNSKKLDKEYALYLLKHLDVLYEFIDDTPLLISLINEEYDFVINYENNKLPISIIKKAVEELGLKKVALYNKEDLEKYIVDNMNDEYEDKSNKKSNEESITGTEIVELFNKKEKVRRKY